MLLCTPGFLALHVQAHCMILSGLANRGEAYLIPDWLMREQRLAQVKNDLSTMMQV